MQQPVEWNWSEGALNLHHTPDDCFIQRTETYSMSKVPTTLREQLLRECDAMARYALASGLPVPPAAMAKLQRQLDSRQSGQPQGSEAGDDTPGVQQPSELAATSDEAVRDAVEIHHILATLVAPATPRTIVLLAEESVKHRYLRFLGAVPIERQMMMAAILALVSIVAISLSPDVNTNTSVSDPLVGSGIPLLWNALFYISAAALGASISALFTVNRYVVLGTYDPKYQSSYWVRFLLGIIAGVVLADFIPLEGNDLEGVTKPLLAILGGFSATIVYRILTRLVETFESLFREGSSERIAAVETSVKAQYEGHAAREKIRLARQLIALRLSLGNRSDAGKVGTQLDQIVDELVSSRWDTQNRQDKVAATEPPQATI